MALFTLSVPVNQLNETRTHKWNSDVINYTCAFPVVTHQNLLLLKLPVCLLCVYAASPFWFKFIYLENTKTSWEITAIRPLAVRSFDIYSRWSGPICTWFDRLVLWRLRWPFFKLTLKVERPFVLVYHCSFDLSGHWPQSDPGCPSVCVPTPAAPHRRGANILQLMIYFTFVLIRCT